jgi:tetratricopeptide (TPR) repeat protein
MAQESLDAGDYRDAIRQFEEALAIDPTNGAIKSGLGRANLAMSNWYLRRGLTDKAFDELIAAKSHVPSDDDSLRTEIGKAFNAMGDRYRHAGEIDWAVTCYKRAFGLDEDDLGYREDLAGGYYAKGKELFDEGDYVGAEWNIQQAVDLFQSRQSYLDLLAAAQDAQG